MRTSAVALALLVSASGCLGGPSADRERATPSWPGAGTTDLGHPLDVAPWKEGSWVEYEVDAPYGWSGRLTAVVQDGAFVADSRRWAIEEATLDLPVLGLLDPATLSTTAFGGDWCVPCLPLTDGGSWNTTLTLPGDFGAPETVGVVATARPETVFTPVRQEAGFLVSARSGDRVVVESAYSPSMHLPTFLRILGASGNVTWSATAVGLGQGWGGARWAATSTPLVSDHALVTPDAAAAPGTFRPAMAAEANVPGGGTTVFGYLIAVAFGGAAQATVVDPAGGSHQATAAGAPVGWEVSGLDVPAIAGTWRAVGVAGGVVGFAGIFLWDVDVRQVGGPEPASS